VSAAVNRHDDGSSSWACEQCGQEVTRYRGQSDVDCGCGASYNASGQRLRDDWRRTLAYDDGECGDLEAYERGCLAAEYGQECPMPYMCERETAKGILPFEKFGPTGFTAECFGLRLCILAPVPARAEVFVMPGDDPCPINRSRAIVYRELKAANGHTALCRAFTLCQDIAERARADVEMILSMIHAVTATEYLAGKQN
jgi:hypothetical protein